MQLALRSRTQDSDQHHCGASGRTPTLTTLLRELHGIHQTARRRATAGQHRASAKVKGIAPLVAKTDRIDARVLAGLVRRDLVSEIWLPTPDVRCMGASAKWTSSTSVSDLLKLSMNAPESTGR